jgi:ATP-dependent DNA helicase Q4
MRDQLLRLPPGLPGAMLQGAMTKQQVEDVLGRAASGQLRILFLGPEKLASGAVLSALRALPSVPLVCVDEAHCVAEWGHGFRPAYFRLGHLLQRVLRPRAVLALTATATAPTRECICRLLAIPAAGVLMDAPMRSNLRLRVEHVNGGSKGGEIAARIVTLITRGGSWALVLVLCLGGEGRGGEGWWHPHDRPETPCRHPAHTGTLNHQHTNTKHAPTQ